MRLQDTDFQYLEQYPINIFTSNNYTQRVILCILESEILAYAENYMAQHNELGKKGEQLAVDFLLENGYEIIERNYRFDKAEVDIIAKKETFLAIIEVKTRSTIDFGNPQDFVKPKQIQHLVKAVDVYVNENELDVEVRFDIIAIVKEDNGFIIEHLENAFYHF